MPYGAAGVLEANDVFKDQGFCLPPLCPFTHS